jgi:hypothetical protein
MNNEICPRCFEFEVYSQSLTNGLCLNCHHNLQEENRLMEIEFRHDYEEGLL